MATSHFSSLLKIQPSFLPSPPSRDGFFPCRPPALLRRRRKQHTMRPAMNTDLLGDFGARDPFPAELESKFGEKVLGFPDTEHRILIPNLAALSLAQLRCDPKSPPLPVEDARKLLKKVVGWRLVECEGEGVRLQCVWKVRDYGCGVELINRICKVVMETGHYPCVHLEHLNQVRAEFWTPSVGGLSINDFIVAAKIDKINTFDLIPKKRIWA